jgi:site-specific DNA recombinase
VTYDACPGVMGSFVSAFPTPPSVWVTQALNTTTSMGRLTLNMLLSFAQFEREVTGERIRDKVAASKQKGIWMGGAVPLGYRVENRTLQVVGDHAAFVLRIAKTTAARADWMVVVAVLAKRSARQNSLVTGRITGNCPKFVARPLVLGRIAPQDQSVARIFPRLPNREFFQRSRERFAQRRENNAAAATRARTIPRSCLNQPSART